MTTTKPFKRTARQFEDGNYVEGGRSQYIRHSDFSLEPGHFIRAFDIIQKDLIEIFDYIEPSEVNLVCYSYRIHQLYLRSCIEVEANFKAILTENEYSNRRSWKIADYKKIESSHFLSMYEVKIPCWREGPKIVKPFEGWTERGKPQWYADYNAVKHNRHEEFSKANLSNLVLAVSGLVGLLSAQFLGNDFAPTDNIVIDMGGGDGFKVAIGGFFRVKYPQNLPENARYNFDWQVLKNDPHPIEKFDYNVI